MDFREEYRRWLEKADADIAEELKKIEGNDAAIEDAFYRDLAFGTGGLRGVIGAGTNRMNVHTVAKASQGLANYVNATFPEGKRKIAVSYDSRIKSDLFSRVASAVFAENGIEVWIYPQLMPTPCLSYAVRALGCAAGVMVTASHNPAKYNGYKVYGPDGCQITTEAAAVILAEIEKLDVFADVKRGDFDALLAQGKIRWIGEDVYTAFVEEVKRQTPVRPDEAMALGMETAKREHADLLLATDPDCDRCGIAVKNEDGDYVLLSGNETGMLLLDYVCARRTANGTMPERPVMVKTIVTIDMAERIAAKYGVETVNVLTGFKFIGEQIGLLEKKGEANRYIFGFEESYGYLSGTYVRDKDAVNAAFLICEMFAWYRTRGVSLLQRLNELYAEYGFCLNTLHSFEFEGSAGMQKMQGLMAAFRADCGSIGGLKVEKILDYAPGLDGLPKSDVLKYRLANNGSVVVRPSSTEPKLKTYISVSAPSREEAAAVEKRIAADLAARMA